jgi:adenylate cyclase
MEVGILFADIRGFTAWSEKRSPDAVAAGLTQFYALASRVLTRDDALVEFFGDQVMALYLPNFPSLGERTAEVMVVAARRLLHEVHGRQSEDALPIGVGIHMGVASVGNVGKGEIKDFTAVGDAVNTTARLQSCALAGQIILSDEVHRRAASSCPRADPASFSVKGKSEPLQAYVIHEQTEAPDHTA